VPPSFQAPVETFGRTESFAAIASEWKPLARPEPRALTDTALLQYTSGTTGAPKGAEITHGNIVANCELQRVYIQANDDDVVLAVLPWFHITGMECQLNLATYLGTPLVALGRFDLETVLAAIQRYRCTATTLIATVNVAIANHPGTRDYDLSSLRVCCSGGAPVPQAVAERWEAVTGFKIVEGYGLSETTAPTHINPPHRPKYGTVGLALPFTDVKLVAVEDGVTEVALGEAGEVVVRGPMVMKGYWRKPEATRETLRECWLATGDIGTFGRRGLPAHRGAQEGPHQGVGLQRLPRRGGGGPLSPSGHPGGGRGRRSRRIPRRGRGGLRGDAPRVEGRGQRAAGRRMGPRADGRVQGATPGPVPRQAPAHRQREGPAPRAAGDGPAAGLTSAPPDGAMGRPPSWGRFHAGRGGTLSVL
jgi:hypothetical protein